LEYIKTFDRKSSKNSQARCRGKIISTFAKQRIPFGLNYSESWKRRVAS